MGAGLPLIEIMSRKRTGKTSDSVTYFLPRECPKCERIISPAHQPRIGDMAICPLCDAVLVFIDDLLLRLATVEEKMNAQSST